MYTECPSCKTFFKITPNQLKAAGGKVRCGNCSEVFSALDGLVDVVPADAVTSPQTEALTPTELPSGFSDISNTSSIDSEVVENTEKPELEIIAESEAESAAELSEALSIQLDAETALEQDLEDAEKKSEQKSTAVSSVDEAESLADIELPDIELPDFGESVVEDDIELALKSAVVENASDAVSSEAVESKTVTMKDEISNDIDAALDGLFDGDTEMPISDSAPSSNAVSQVSAISELEELQDLDFGDLGESTAKKETSPASGSVSAFAALQSEVESSVLGSVSNLENEVSSLSEFERELENVSATKAVASEPLAESSFDLGDSFLDSDMPNSTKTDAKSKIDDSDETPSDSKKGDSYIFEELEGKKKRKPGSESGSVGAKVAWVVVIFALLIVLLGQFAYLKRQDLAMYPEVKPVIEKFCAVLSDFYPCEITPAKDVKAIELLERNVVSHPNAENALLITSTIENKAKFDQAFPDLVLTFSDINQKIIAKRKFTPTEYLSKSVDIDAGMKKQVPVKIMLEIVDPGEEAVNFEFDFE